MPPKRILCVGNCAADHGTLKRFLSNHFDVEVEAADAGADALERLETVSHDLVLVNRVFDADGASGLELIRQLKSHPRWKSVPVMLLSNYDEYQRQAVTAGAQPGFGKAQLSRPETLVRLREVLG